MKITICGSMVFHKEMLDAKNKLEKMGHEVKVPVMAVKDDKNNIIEAAEYHRLRQEMDESKAWIWQKKNELMKEHFNKVEWSDSILVLNYPKNDIPGYIGSSSLLEMGIAIYLNKRIYLINKIPDMPYKEEILGMMPVIINGDLNLIK